MKVIVNDIIPFRGFLAINLFGVLFARREAWNRANDHRKAVCVNHESIHTEQMKETLYVGFYILYLIMWLIRLLTPPFKTAYRDISFEQEAYEHEQDLTYLATRKPYTWLSYCFKSSRDLTKGGSR